jgi:transcriptional regulator with XRE-family HTH domain
MSRYPSYGDVDMTQNQNKLREIRVTEGLTAAELSRLSEINEKTIREIEKGRREGNEVTRRKILNGLNKSPRRSRVWKYDEVFGA